MAAIFHLCNNLFGNFLTAVTETCPCFKVFCKGFRAASQNPISLCICEWQIHCTQCHWQYTTVHILILFRWFVKGSLWSTSSSTMEMFFDECAPFWCMCTRTYTQVQAHIGDVTYSPTVTSCHVISLSGFLFEFVYSPSLSFKFLSSSVSHPLNHSHLLPPTCL